MKKWSSPELLNLEVGETKSVNHVHCECGYSGPSTGKTWTCPVCKARIDGGLCNCEDYVAPSHS